MPRGRHADPDDARSTGAAPAAAPAVAPQQQQQQQIVALQQSAGNAAVSRAIAGGGPTLARNPFSSLFKRKKGPKISGPSNARPMTPEEQNGVLSMNQLIKQFETSLNVATAPGDSAGATVAAGVAVVVAAAEKAAAKVEDAQEGETKQAEAQQPQGQAPESEPEGGGALDGIGEFFSDLERQVEEYMERERQFDEELFNNAKRLGGVLDAVPSGGLLAKAGYAIFAAAVRAWMGNSRRKLNLPEDAGRRQELEAMLQDKLWIVDATEASSATLQPNPELLAKDKEGYFVDTSADLYLIQADGTLDANSVHFTEDQYLELDGLTASTVDGNDGYTLDIGGDIYFVHDYDVVIKQGGFEKVSGPLFPPDPEPAHVQQTTLGDCYLQAAVASVAHKNPGLIKAMMRDNGDDTVTVRLYRVNATDPKNKTFTADYVKVEKSVPKNFAGQEVYNKGALWVRLIEKAYAAGGFTGQIDKAAPPVRSYEGIASGFSEYAVEVLTGTPMQDTWDQNKGWHANVASSLPWDANEVVEHNTAKSSGSYDAMLSFRILGDKAKVDTWIGFVKTNKIKEMFDAKKDAYSKGFAGDVTLKDLDDAMKTLDGAIKATMLGWIERNQLYPGELGTAKYSKTQLDIFTRMKETLERGGIVTGGTRKYPKGEVTAGTGASGGEAQHAGVVGGHAYSFLATRSYATADPESPAPGDFFWVKVRNPWGSYGRKYDMSKGADAGEAVEGGDGVSWMELSDVTRYFDQLNYG